MRALEKVPADRFQTVSQFKEALLGRGNTSTYVRRTRAHTLTMHANDAARVRRRKRTLAAGALAMVLLASSALAGRYYWWERPHRAAAAGDVDAKRVGVLYFDDQSKNGDLRFLADGLTESLIDELSRVPALYVVSKNGVRPFRGVSVAVDSLARVLRVGSVVRGSVEQVGKGVKVTVRLVDPQSDVDLARKSFEADTASLAVLQGRVADEVALFLRQQVGDEVQLRDRRQGTSSTTAWTLVERAEKRRKDADSVLAAGHLEIGLATLDTADTMLAHASELDAAWGEPLKLRSSIAARRVRALRDKPFDAAPSIDSGLAWSERLLALDPRNADGYELRGALRYQRFMLHLTRDARDAENTLQNAEQDLLKAVEINPAQAAAWATLSSLYYRVPNPQKANQAAREAYKADAFLTNASEILKRLFWTSHDTEAYPDAQQWCSEGRRRFPLDPFFTECQLWMFTTKAVRPDPDSAWRLVLALKKVTPDPSWPYEQRYGEILVAGALARASLSDSARRVLLRAREGATEVDPRKELVGTEAVVRAILRDYDETVRLIEDYLVVNPEHRKGFANYTGPWWRDPQLQNNRKFKALIAGAR